ncbi:MAG: Zn-dependent oligopeptidase [Deltaproteobacteria bacterium]|nr:Zn-dependent oligopeptidase [Deltaproteobacteria bacterium]
MRSSFWSFLVVSTLFGCASSEKKDAPQEHAAPSTASSEEQGKTPAPLSKKGQAFMAACNSAMQKADAQLGKLAAISGGATVASVVRPLDDLTFLLDEYRNKSDLFSSVDPDEGVRDAAQTCSQEVAKRFTNISLSRPIFDALAKVDTSAEDDVTKRYVLHLLRDFRRSGVDKGEAERTLVKTLNEEILKLGQEFGKNIREHKIELVFEESDLDGLPDDYKKAHAAKDGKVVLSTDYPDYYPFMTYGKNDAARKKYYQAFRKRGYPQNMKVLDALIAKRHALATVLGYSSWADYITEDKMIGSAKNAHDFIDKINTAARSRSDRDYNELLKRLQQDNKGATSVGDWQKTYLQNLVKKEKYAFDSSQVRSYFTYAQTRQGLFDLTEKMFGITYRKSDTPAWDASVEAWDLLDGDEVIGHFNLDMHPRDNKYKHAAMFPMLTGVTGKQLPQASLVCNFPADGPMEFSQVETFFHEFGHLLHHLFAGKHSYVGISGISTEWDFVEAPSQIFEEWAQNKNVLKTFAKNEKGEVLPDDLIDALKKANTFGRGLWVRHQMFYAATSLGYYDTDPASLDTTAKMKTLQTTYSPFAYVDDTFFQTSFGHLDGYSAIYYTYMWSLVIAQDMFSRFKKEGMLSPAVAKNYREKVLAPGGSKDAKVLVEDFIGRETSFDAFAAWLDE